MNGPQQERTVDREALLAAREVARQVVADRWPDLAEVEPTVTRHHKVCPPHKVLQRAGVQPSDIIFTPELGVAEFTFTFSRETCTPDGHALPHVARVTVDTHQRVVKTTSSK